MNGNAACKIKTWPNTTGEISNILYENVVLNGGVGSNVMAVSTYYCGCTDPQKGWCHLFTPRPLNKCTTKNICPAGKGHISCAAARLSFSFAAAGLAVTDGRCCCAFRPWCTVPDGSCCAEAWPNGTLLPEIDIKNIT